MRSWNYKLTQDAQKFSRLKAVKAVVNDDRAALKQPNCLALLVVRFLDGFSLIKMAAKLLCVKKAWTPLLGYALSSISSVCNLVNIIRDCCPDQLKFPYALWTRETIRYLIEMKYEVRLALNTVGNYLKWWGFTTQKPLRRVYQHQDSAVRKWLENTYPQIALKAREQADTLY